MSIEHPIRPDKHAKFPILAHFTNRFGDTLNPSPLNGGETKTDPSEAISGESLAEHTVNPVLPSTLETADSTVMNAKPNIFSRRKFVTVAGLAAAGVAFHVGNKDTLAAPELNGNGVDLPYLLKPVAPGVDYGATLAKTHIAFHNKVDQYGKQGISAQLIAGLNLGSYYLNGQEFIMTERGAYHWDNGVLQRVRVIGDIAEGKIQLNSNNGWFDLPQQSKDAISSAVISDQGPDVPTFGALVQKGLLFSSGSPTDPIGASRADKFLDRNGNVIPNPEVTSFTTNNTFEKKYMAPQTGRYVPVGIANFLDSQYKGKALEIYGLPMSDPYWIKVQKPLNGQLTDRYVMWQAFERGTVTFDPMNDTANQYQGGLSGRLFARIVGAGFEPPVSDSFDGTNYTLSFGGLNYISHKDAPARLMINDSAFMSKIVEQVTQHRSIPPEGLSLYIAKDLKDAMRAAGTSDPNAFQSSALDNRGIIYDGLYYQKGLRDHTVMFFQDKDVWTRLKDDWFAVGLNILGAGLDFWGQDSTSIIIQANRAFPQAFSGERNQ